MLAIDLVQFFRDAKFVPDLEWPQHSSNADRDTEAPQIFQVDLVRAGVGPRTINSIFPRGRLRNERQVGRDLLITK